jgi:RNA polymerase sigma-70 factor (sigma-E family)
MANRRERAEEFGEYVAVRRRHLRRFAFLLCSDWHQAEDLTQIALTKLYVAWPRIKGEGVEEAYARQIVVRCYLDERRRPWRRETATALLPERAALSGLSYEDNDRLRALIRALPARQRAVIVLRYWCDLSLEETARDLRCSVGTVKSQASRAVERLRAALVADERIG